ncbi:MAG: hypothetical protein EOM88_03360 [Clostridia bacterium]|nr:hypothetical protein [Clostridia bacterium]
MKKIILFFSLAIIISVAGYLIIFGIPNFNIFHFNVANYKVESKALSTNCREAASDNCPTISLDDCVGGLSPKPYLLSQNSIYSGVPGIDKDSDIYITEEEASNPKLFKELSINANTNFPDAHFYSFTNHVFPGADIRYYVNINNTYCPLSKENLKKIFSPILNINDALAYISLKKVVDNDNPVMVKEKQENDGYYSFILTQSECAGSFYIKAKVYGDAGIEETESFSVKPEVKSGMLQCD